MKLQKFVRNTPNSRMLKFSFIITTSLLLLVLANSEYTFKNKIQFPFGGPFMGIFLALALPLDVEELDVFVAYNFEASYLLPENQTEFTYPPLITMDRKFVYNIFETKLNSNGFPGKLCLLKTICEAAECSTENTGILGDLLHIILTPSSSNETGLSKEYSQAEEYGRRKKHCKRYDKSCPFSLLKLISWTGEWF